MEPLNREQRRHPEKIDEPDEVPGAPREQNPTKVPDSDMRSNARVQDDLSVRAKNSGHGKKTADKWNQ
jgi:hypothetical protein